MRTASIKTKNKNKNNSNNSIKVINSVKLNSKNNIAFNININK